jgi:uncharacterized protein (TIGR03435 family)
MITEDGFWTVTRVEGRRFFDAPRITMPGLAHMLGDCVEEPVLDMTGLNGAYQVSLKIPLSVPQVRASQNPAAVAAGAEKVPTEN